MGCVFCNETAFSEFDYPVHLFRGKEFKYVCCVACSLKYLHPMPTSEEIAAMYVPSYHANTIDLSITKKYYQKQCGTRFNYGIQFDLINKYVGNKAAILDFGCGDGNFIVNAIQQGFTCDGAEFDYDYIKLLKEGLPKVTIYHIDEFYPDKKLVYDVIRLSNVIEHIVTPAATINALLPQLRPNGILLIEAPLEDNPSVSKWYRNLYIRFKRRSGYEYKYYTPPYHIIMATAKNQRTFFQQFDIKEKTFIVDEFAWPFPESIKSAKGFTQKALAIFFSVAMFISRLLHKGRSGNGFLYVGQKSSNR
jgi:SAM-dependent methyltransferase